VVVPDRARGADRVTRLGIEDLLSSIRRLRERHCTLISVKAGMALAKADGEAVGGTKTGAHDRKPGGRRLRTRAGTGAG
jgi:hypothetical protein